MPSARRLIQALDAAVPNLRRQLRRVLELVRSCESSAIVGPMHQAAFGSDESLRAYLVSNELWGGFGSIADQAGFAAKDPTTRRSIEKRLVELGEMQLAANLVNPRTSSWVEGLRASK